MFIPGIRKIALTTASLVITSSAALISAGLASAIAAGQTQKLRWWIPINVGATGGVRMQVLVPAGGVVFDLAIKLVNTVAPSITPAFQAASAAFTNALANTGNHWLEVEATIVNGATAGTVDLQIAQNTSDALSLTVLRGASCEVTTF